MNEVTSSDDFRNEYLLEALNILEIPVVIIFYPQCRFVITDSTNSREFASLLLGREVTAEEQLGRVFQEFDFRPEAVLFFREILHRVGREKKALRFNQVKFTAGQNYSKCFNIAYSPVLDEHGVTSHIVGTAVDVSHQARLLNQHQLIANILDFPAEQEDDWAKMTLRTVLDSISSLVIITDENYKIAACSKAGLEILEMAEDEVIGQPVQRLNTLFTFQPPDFLNETAEGKRFTNKIQTTITTRSGTTKTLLIGSTPIINREGEVTGLVQDGIEITAPLEQQEKLIESERLALIGQLTSGIVHEVKNPLTVISGFAELTKNQIEKIDDHDLKKAILHYQQEIIDNCQNMNRLIIDLLQLAKPGRMEPVQVNLAGVLEKISNSIEPYAMQHNVTICRDFSAADVEIMIDPQQIGQVLLNLCNNAIQAMEQGGMLTVFTTRHNGFIVIGVADTGEGIPPEHLAKLGTPFFTTKAEGTGLGLSIAYRIIKDHGGRVEVESEVGKGTTFRIYLPLLSNTYKQ